MEIDRARGDTIRLMLGRGATMREAARAIGVASAGSVCKWVQREEAAGRPVHIPPRERTAPPAPGTRPDSSTPAAPPPPNLDEVEALSPEQAQRVLSWHARYDPDPRVRVSALNSLLSWKERQPAPSAEPERVPAELLAAWRDETFGPFLRRLMTRAAAGA